MMVEEIERKEVVLGAMSDPYMKAIITSTIDEAKSVEQIGQENGIPISTCYRRVHELLDGRLLRIENIILTDTGRKYETFRSNFKDIKVVVSLNELTVEVTRIPRIQDDPFQSIVPFIKR